MKNIVENKEDKELTVINRTRVITFNNPYEFECETYKELNLSGLDDLTTEELLYAEKVYTKSGGTAINPETTGLFSMILAQTVSNVPFEFFSNLPAKEFMKIKKEVYNFFYRAG